MSSGKPEETPLIRFNGTLTFAFPRRTAEIKTIVQGAPERICQ